MTLPQTNQLPFGGKSFFLPRKYKTAGYCLIVLGIICAAGRFYYGIKPEIFDLKVWAVYSSFLETKYFAFITNNVSEEVTALLLLSGLLCAAFSREKIENRVVKSYRLRALVAAIIINYFALLLAVIFVFGLGFVEILVVNMFSPLVIFLLIFNYYLFRNRAALSEPVDSGLKPE